MGPCKNIGRTLAFLPSLSVIYGRIRNDSKTWRLEIIVIVSLLILWGGFHGTAHRLQGLLAELVHICSQLIGQRVAGSSLMASFTRLAVDIAQGLWVLFHVAAQQPSAGFLAWRLGSDYESRSCKASEDIGLESAQRHFHCWTRQATQIAGSRDTDFTSRWEGGNITLQRDGKGWEDSLQPSLQTDGHVYMKSEDRKSLKGFQLERDIFKRSLWLF